ncbi:MAG: hypothetical protein ACOCWQ_05075 [Nanoarchaeota archaeon]
MNLDDLLKRTTVTMTDLAEQKTQYLASRISHMAQRSLEIFAVPLGRVFRFGDHTHILVDDIYIPSRQKIRPASFDYDPVQLSNDLSRLGIEGSAVGWIHSHAAISPFHSGIDHDSLLELLDYVPRSFREDTEYGQQDYYLLPSIVFNEEGRTPDLRVYGKCRQIRIDNGIPTGSEQTKSWVEKEFHHDVACHEALPLATCQEIDQSISSILHYNDIAPRQEERIIHPGNIRLPSESDFFTQFASSMIARHTYQQKFDAFYDALKKNAFFPKSTVSHWETLGSILQGRYRNPSTQRICWSWKDRYALFCQYLSTHADAYHPHISMACKHILLSHRYLQTQHHSIATRLDVLLDRLSQCTDSSHMSGESSAAMDMRRDGYRPQYAQSIA